uniref:Uncharacterized protein n=1 Tax=Globisporangium ultimum (strain ATCC 200006 / CBS 805.95 / DAOM BR144) TaxID=431595 RepID=K3X6J1_GLOUD
MGGFEVVKYSRNGLPHRTKLRLSNDGKSIAWQPKLFKRGLLRYQNARTISSLFGITKDNNSSSHPQLHVPQVNRLSSCEVVCGGKHGEPSLDDDGDTDRRKSALSSTGSNSSNNSSTSDGSSTSEKKLWWKSFRRDRGKAERTASGGFSLSFTTRSSASSFEGSYVSPSPGRVSSATVPVAPLPDKLDDSVHLSDIRAMLTGDQSEFFMAHKSNLPYGCKRAVDPGCVLSVTTRFRELHLEFQNEEVRDGFAYLLEQATLPLQKTVAEEESRYANVSRVSSSEKDDETTELKAQTNSLTNASKMTENMTTTMKVNNKFPY